MDVCLFNKSCCKSNPCGEKVQVSSLYKLTDNCVNLQPLKRKEKKATLITLLSFTLHLLSSLAALRWDVNLPVNAVRKWMVQEERNQRSVLGADKLLSLRSGGCLTFMGKSSSNSVITALLMAEELHHYDNFFYSCEPKSSLLFLLSRAVIEACLYREETVSPGLLGRVWFLRPPTPHPALSLSACCTKQSH